MYIHMLSVTRIVMSSYQRYTMTDDRQIQPEKKQVVKNATVTYDLYQKHTTC